MFLIELPNTTPIESPVILADAQGAAKKHGEYYAQAGVCQVVPSSNNSIVEQIGDGSSLGNNDFERRELYDYTITSVSDVIDAFVLKDPDLGQSYRAGIVPPNLENRVDYYKMDLNDVVIKTIQNAKHGHLYNNWLYLPNPGFVGIDHFIVEGTLRGRTVKLFYDIHVIGNNEFQKAHSNLTIFSKMLQKNCPNDTEWLIPGSIKNPNRGDLSSPGDNNLTRWLSIISDFSVHTLAHITGAGFSVQITFDTNATGYGWFVDGKPAIASRSADYMKSSKHAQINIASITGMRFPANGK